MKIPASLVKDFVTSEFPENRLTTTGEYCVNSFFEEDKKRKLYINAETGVFICFKSGISGSFLKLVREYAGLNTVNEALEYLVQNYSFKFDKTEEIKTIKEEDRQVLVDFMTKDRPVFFKDPTKLGSFGKKAYSYLLNRKLEEEYYPQLGYVFNQNSKYNERVIIPFYENGKIVYFITRAIDPNNPIRYFNASGLDSKQYVFNIDKINEEVVIAEGSFDAMSITTDQAATALLSADIGLTQLEKIFKKKPKSLIYVPDHDETGRKKMDSNIKKILTYCPYTGLEIYIFDVPNGCKDLNDMKIKTGKNYILKKECEKYGSNLFSRSIF